MAPPAELGDIDRYAMRDHSPEYLETDESIDEQVRFYSVLTRMLARIEDARKPIKKAIIERIANHAGVEGAWGKIHYKANKPSKKVEWKKVATALHPEPELIEEYTTIKTSARAFRAYIDEDHPWVDAEN